MIMFIFTYCTYKSNSIVNKYCVELKLSCSEIPIQKWQRMKIMRRADINAMHCDLCEYSAYTSSSVELV